MTGNLANLVTYRLALILALVGMFVGFIAEGDKMTHSVFGKLIQSTIGVQEILIGLSVTFFLFLILTIVKIPVSLSNCVVGSFVGVALASKAVLSVSFLIEVLASWIIAPFFCMGVVILIYLALIKSEKSISVPTVSWINRLVLFGVVFYVAYALGANNVGMILSFAINANHSLGSVFGSELAVEAGIYFGIALGTAFFGKALAKVVGDKIISLSQIKILSSMLGAAFVTWLFTQFSVPVSLTQVVIGGMLGAGSARGPTVINRSVLVTMIRDWVIVTLLCTGTGFGFSYLIINH
jgi:phosphate/sulfate permease